MLTSEQKHVLYAYIDAIEQTTTGIWPSVENHMKEFHGIGDPDSALEDARNGLQS